MNKNTQKYVLGSKRFNGQIIDLQKEFISRHEPFLIDSTLARNPICLTLFRKAVERSMVCSLEKIQCVNPKRECIYCEIFKNNEGLKL